ncbi:hypothetical protein Athai_08460 [Actinocatenispora thailandica]|uniref:Uncharacterized protein n=1 Tax=Actinocatenispora thailandica TaxID=227318 RepID=A0A7R7DKM1_9ACTN|nr:Rv3235 family protein [Actinocatenispora thailandica]BCJ33343.1 hypothetical protein Athai_08460 [Actinocatenispora thailandica]
MATPLPADPFPEPIPGPYPRLVPDDDLGALRVLPPPDTEPDHDPDPYWVRPRLSAVAPRPPRARPAADDDADGADPGEHPPGAQRAAWLLINGYLEVLAGRRPASQLAGPATPAAARQLIQVTPNPQRRLRLFRLHVIEQLPGRAEVVVLLTDLDRGQVLAIALRLVHADGSWRCADFQGVW